MESLTQIQKIQQLFIISYNINSYFNRLQEINHLISLDPDILFLSETKLSKSQRQQLKQNLDGTYSDTNIYDGYYNYFASSDHRAGVGIFIKKVLKIKEVKTKFDNINNSYGRIIHLQILYENQQIEQLLDFIFLYTPNSGRQLKTLDFRNKWDQQFLEYCQQLDNLLCVMGDLNIIPTQYDIHNFKKNYNKSAGVTQLEICNYQQLLNQINLVNTIRYLHQTQRIYTYFSYFGQSKQNNKGWTLDHILLSAKYIDNLIDSNVIKIELNTSDHLPIYIKLKLF